MDLLVALGISIGILIGAWVYVAVGMPELGLIVWAGIIAFIFCVQAKIPLLGFIPGAFLGAATWVGVDVAGAAGDGGMVDAADIMIPVSMVVGAVLGYISEVAGKKMAA